MIFLSFSSLLTSLLLLPRYPNHVTDFRTLSRITGFPCNIPSSCIHCSGIPSWAIIFWDVLLAPRFCIARCHVNIRQYDFFFFSFFSTAPFTRLICHGRGGDFARIKTSFPVAPLTSIALPIEVIIGSLQHLYFSKLHSGTATETWKSLHPSHFFILFTNFNTLFNLFPRFIHFFTPLSFEFLHIFHKHPYALILSNPYRRFTFHISIPCLSSYNSQSYLTHIDSLSHLV